MSEQNSKICPHCHHPAPLNQSAEPDSQTGISKKSESEAERCPIHHKKIKYICWTDQEKICNQCLVEKHRDRSSHDLRPPSLLKELISPRIKCLEDLEPKIATLWEKIESLFEEQKKDTLNMIESRFNDFRFILNAKEVDFKHEISSFYEKKIDKLQLEVGESSFARRILCEKVGEYQKIFQSPKPFELLEENLSDLFNIIQESLNSEKVNQMKDILQQIRSNIDSKLSNQLSALEKIDVLPENLTWAWEEADLKLNDKLYSRAELEKYQENFNASLPIIDSTEKDLIVSWRGLIISYPFKAKIRRNLDILKDSQNISSLEFKIRKDFENLGQEDISMLCYIRNKFPEIQRVDIDIEECQISDDVLLNIFWCLLWKNNSLKTLRLGSKMKGLFDKSISFLAENILRLAHLTNFQILFDNCEATQKAWNSLSQNLTQLAENLTCLYFVLNCKDADSISLKKLFVHMPKLEDFAYKANIQAFNDQVLQKFVSNTLPSLANLTSFQLLIQNSTVSDLSVKKLFSSFPEEWFLKLSMLRVGLDNTDTTDESLSDFLDTTLEKFKVLTNFGIYSNRVTPIMSDKLSKWEKEFSEKSKKV